MSTRRKRSRNRAAFSPLIRSKTDPYARFSKIDGRHSFKKAVENGFVDYEARRKKGGIVRFFNFKLAKEMGLIPEDHPLEMNRELSKRILETFSIQIINEWDIENNIKVPPEEKLSGTYMATRYLQLQHPDKRGLNSGDGRGVWNGQIRHKNITWDISACGTGATRLSPATTIEGRFFRTGDPKVSYGCGQADLEDGLYAGIISEIFHQNGIPTERTLAVIEFDKKISINIRASQNLLRPAHMFLYLKQKDHESLKQSVDYFINREIQNGKFKSDLKSDNDRYRELPFEMARRFAKAAALYQTEYIFVWMDWDGDNILADGGIIDYGSIRQFGLYHHEYRYDDVDRMSTSIAEQRIKARQTVETFAQLAEFLISKEKKSRSSFQNCEVTKLFDREFTLEVRRRTLLKMGLRPEWIEYLIHHEMNLIKDFRHSFHYFERQKSSRGKQQVADGVTWDAIFCMRDAMRELPSFLLQKARPPSPGEFMSIISSIYASRKDQQVGSRAPKINRFLDLYLKITQVVCEEFNVSMQKVLLEMTMRASITNRYDRITGESMLRVVGELIKNRDSLSKKEFLQVIDELIQYQDILPGKVNARVERLRNERKPNKKEALMEKILRIVEEYREDL